MLLFPPKYPTKCVKRRQCACFSVYLIKNLTSHLKGNQQLTKSKNMGSRNKKGTFLGVPFSIYGFTISKHCFSSGFSIIKLNNHSRSCSIS